MKISVCVTQALFVKAENTAMFLCIERSPPPLSGLALNAVLVHHHGVMILEARDLAGQQLDELFRRGKFVGSRDGPRSGTDQHRGKNKSTDPNSEMST